jgi:hypothetical protein
MINADTHEKAVEQGAERAISAALLDSSRFQEAVPILNTYLRKQHGCMLVLARGTDVAVVSSQGKRLFQTASFAVALEFALKHEDTP